VGGNALQDAKTFSVFYKLEVQYRQNRHFWYGDRGFLREIMVMSTDWALTTFKCIRIPGCW